MRFYTAKININGDRNHVRVKSELPPAEIKVLQAIHGSDSVYDIAKQMGADRNMPVAELVDRLQKQYGRTRVSRGGDEKRPVLVGVFPGWPNIDTVPTDLKAAGVNPALIKSDDDDTQEGPKPVTQNTYWQHEGTGELGLTEKGDVLPEGVTRIKKADYEALLEQRKAENGDNSFTE